jgi:PTH1 family peptidyl-tRNA hydrolase
LGGVRVLLLKPETFMNLSGQSVQAAASFHKIETADITVFHDELDLPPAKIKAKFGGGHAGHNGLRSIHAHMGEGYGRVRLGIGHPGDKNRVADYVLHDFAKADQVWLDDLMAGISDGAVYLAGGDSAKFLNAVALRLSPPKEKKPAPSTEAKPSEAKPTQAQPSEAKPANLKPNEAAPVDTRSPLEKLRDRFRP